MDYETSPAIRKTMQGNRSRDTKPELRLRSILHGRGLRRTADVVFTKARVAVFVDGCFWHGCPEHYRRPGSNMDYWDAKVLRNVARDREVDKLLADAGWIIIRAWEHEDPESVADRIEALVRGTKFRRPVCRFKT